MQKVHTNQVACFAQTARHHAANPSCLKQRLLALQEIRLLRKLSFDANIVQFYGACLQEENTMMVLEYMAVSLAIAIQQCSCCSVRDVQNLEHIAASLIITCTQFSYCIADSVRSLQYMVANLAIAITLHLPPC